jgi:hypothetical protein
MFLTKLVNKYNKNYISIITYKKFCQPNFVKGKDAELAFGFDSMHFGNTSGLNNIENRKVLVIVGTYSLKVADKVKKYNELFNANLNSEEYEKMAGEMAQRGKYQDYEGTPLAVIQKAEDDAEQYDAIHRNRGLLYDKYIVVLGILPERIKNEFHCLPLYENNIEKVVKEITETKYIPSFPIDIDKIIELIELGYPNYEIAQKLKIRKKDGKKKGYFDTDLVKCIRDHITPKKTKTTS